MIAFDSFSAPVVGSLLVRVTAVLALSWLGARIAARGSASMRHALWVAAFVGVLALPLAARFMPSLELPLLPAAEQTRLPAPQPAQMASSSAAPRASATPINLTPSRGRPRVSGVRAGDAPDVLDGEPRVDHVARLGLHRLARDWRRSGRPLPARPRHRRADHAPGNRDARRPLARRARRRDRDAGDRRDTAPRRVAGCEHAVHLRLHARHAGRARVGGGVVRRAHRRRPAPRARARRAPRLPGAGDDAGGPGRVLVPPAGVGCRAAPARGARARVR